MKKILFFIFTFVILTVIFVYSKYENFKYENFKIKKNNLDYEVYLNKQVYGNEITTLINKAVDNNEKNEVKKDEKGFYIQDEENSIKIQIKIIDLEKDMVYDMESFYNNNMDMFTKLYSSILFECTKINYNKFGKVNYILFEQKSI